MSALGHCNRHVRFTPESGHWALRTPRGNDTATSEALAAFFEMEGGPADWKQNSGEGPM